MTYAEHIAKLEKLIASLEVAQNSAAYWGLTAAAYSIQAARQALLRDVSGMTAYAEQNAAFDREIA